MSANSLLIDQLEPSVGAETYVKITKLPGKMTQNRVEILRTTVLKCVILVFPHFCKQLAVVARFARLKIPKETIVMAVLTVLKATSVQKNIAIFCQDRAALMAVA